MIDIVYTLSSDEYSEGYKRWVRRTLKKTPGRFLVQLAGALFGGFLGWSIHFLPLTTVAGLIVSYAFLYAICLWRKRAIRQYQYAADAARWHNVHTRFDDQGFQSTRGNASGGWIRWAEFTSWEELPSIYLLTTGAMFIPVPKAALSEPLRQELFSLLTLHIGQAST